MLTNADLAVLNEAYRSSRKGVETINTVISKVYDDDLALDLNRQAVHFLAFEDKAAEEKAHLEIKKTNARILMIA